MKRMLKAILEVEPDALSQKPIWMPDLRVKMMNMNDESFKDMLMQLVKSKMVFLQKHAHPAQASDIEKRLMIDDGANGLYCALAIRETEANRVRKILAEPERKKKKPLSCESTINDVPQKPRGGRGGVREGSGRRCIKLKAKRVQIGFVRLPGWIADWLKAEGDCGKKVEQALIAHYGLMPPD